MTVLDYILDGIEAELQLERELGVRFVECDRGLLTEPKAAVSESPSSAQPPPPPQPSPLPQPRPQPQRSDTTFPYVFLHHAPLGPAGLEMMTKIVEALGSTLERTPIVTASPVPKASVYVVLGSLALRMFHPTLKGVPGMWLETAKGEDVLVTYSPEYILRFKDVTPAVKKIKTDMWRSLKDVARRARSL